ncbi:flagellar assembly protein FliH [Shewanella sp.]|nr:flagellar assembly protein FliH [Shewanella sp.]
MSESTHKPKGATLNTTDEFGHWDLPEISEKNEDAALNMFGRGTLNKQVETVVEATPVLPPTLSEIEDIRAHAEQEGFSQGHKKGHASGLEKGRLTGLEQGHSEGFEQGKEQGYEAGLLAANDMLKRFETLLEQFEQPLNILDLEIEKALLSTSMSLAKSVIGHELKTHPEHILSALRQGIDALPIKKQQVNIRVTPADETLISSLYSAAQLTRNRWDLEADPSLSAGDCVITSGRSHIDMTVESRIEHVFFELVKTEQDLLLQQEQQQDALFNQQANRAAVTADSEATPSTHTSTQADKQPAQQSDFVTEGEHADTLTPVT